MFPLFKVNTHFEFQVHMFSNGRDIAKCPDDNTNPIKYLRFSLKTAKLKTYKKEKYWLIPALSPLPMIFSSALLLRIEETCECLYGVNPLPDDKF